MRERGGRTQAQLIENTDSDHLEKAIIENVAQGSMVLTDEHAGYRRLPDKSYGHKMVNHGANEYVRGDVNTNSIESVWALLKRGVHGVYHHISEKHIARYINEFTFRLNDGNVERNTMDRLASLLSLSLGKHITYSLLTA